MMSGEGMVLLVDIPGVSKMGFFFAFPPLGDLLWAWRCSMAARLLYVCCEKPSETRIRAWLDGLGWSSCSPSLLYYTQATVRQREGSIATRWPCGESIRHVS
jgi:hypothetical protein